jgi:hypothetical protein
VHVRSAERLPERLTAGETGLDHYLIASDEGPCVQAVAETARTIAAEEAGFDLILTHVENPRSGETSAERFDADTS